MTTTAAALVFLSVLFPSKGWYGPDQKWTVDVKPPQGTTVRLVLTDFTGSTLDAAPPAEREFAKDGPAELKRLFPAIGTAGTYLLYAVPQAPGVAGEAKETVRNFVGTPIVVSVREDRRAGAPSGPMVVKLEPLRFAILSTSAGDMTVGFYYDAAPNNIANFVGLAREGFYDGLTFHRVEKDFLIQGGDPRGDGTGGPGYNVDAEFSDRKHGVGVLSMSRNVDPNESPNNPPRTEYANSAGSQFFIVLDDKNGAQLDHVYTVVGRVVGAEGLRVLSALAKTPVGDPKTGRPTEPPVIKKVEVRSVTVRENPYPVIQAEGMDAARQNGESGAEKTPPTPAPAPAK